MPKRVCKCPLLWSIPTVILNPPKSGSLVRAQLKAIICRTQHCLDCATGLLSRKAMISFCRYAQLRVPIGHCLKSMRGHGIATSTCLRAKEVKEVPVATYSQDKTSAQRTILSVDESKSAPSHVSAEDIQRMATPFNKAVVPRMTPTLRAFLLEGKVAVVTGYVLLISHAYIPLKRCFFQKWFLFVYGQDGKMWLMVIIWILRFSYCQLC